MYTICFTTNIFSGFIVTKKKLLYAVKNIIFMNKLLKCDKESLNVTVLQCFGFKS